MLIKGCKGEIVLDVTHDILLFKEFEYVGVIFDTGQW